MDDQFKNAFNNKLVESQFDMMVEDYKSKSIEELAQEINVEFMSMSFMAMLSHGEEASNLIQIIVRASIYMACLGKISETKKKSIISVWPESFAEAVKQNEAVFFGDETDITIELVEQILETNLVSSDSFFKMMIINAVAGGEINEETISKIKELYIKQNSSSSLFDSLINSGMLHIGGDVSSMSKTSKGPANKLWDTIKLSDGTLEITGYKGKDTSIVIPTEIGGIAVTTIGYQCFSPEKDKIRSTRKEIYSNLKKITISAGIKEIRDNAFELCENLEEIEFNEGLIKIGSKILNCCDKIKSVIIPETVEFVGEDAFCCGALETLKMPTSPVKTMSVLSSYNNMTEPVYSGDMTKLYTYPKKSKTKEFIVPNGVKYITDGIFADAGRSGTLDTVKIPEGVEYIGNFTFDGVKNIYLPNSIKELDFCVFGFSGNSTIHTKNPYVINYAKENNIKVIKE